MAKFLNTTGPPYNLEELIKNIKDKLILISPYLQFHKRVRDNLENLNIQNLYSFSQQNNDEMSIYVTKKNDPDLYNDFFNEIQRILTISEEIRVSIKKVDK